MHFTGAQGAVVGRTGPRISMTARFQSRDLDGSNLVILDPNSSFNFQARLATIGTLFDTYGQRMKCPEALVNFCRSQVLLYKAINLQIFKERSPAEKVP